MPDKFCPDCFLGKYLWILCVGPLSALKLRTLADFRSQEFELL